MIKISKGKVGSEGNDFRIASTVFIFLKLHACIFTLHMHAFLDFFSSLQFTQAKFLVCLSI